jgi:hypothetical protein
MALTATFEAGANGNTITTAGGEGAATPFDVITIGTTGSVAYSNAQFAHGGLSALVAQGGTNGQSYVSWTTAFGTVTDHYGRIYIYMTANPAVQNAILRIQGGASQAARIDITTAGKIAGLDSASSALWTTTTNSVALNQWVRIEYHIVHSATVGQGEVKLFNSADSATPTETQIGAANKNTLASADTYKLGIGISVGTQQNNTVWFDDVMANAAGYPGPAGASPGGDAPGAAAIFSLLGR